MSNQDIIKASKDSLKKRRFEIVKLEERITPGAGGDRGRFKIIRLEERIAARPSNGRHCTR